MATAGACELTVELSGGGPLAPPGSATWALSGGGTCAIADIGLLAPATVGGSLSGLQDQPTVGCLAAALDGTLTLDVTAPGYGSMTGDIAVVVSVAGAAPLVAVTVPTLAATGTFAQDPFDTKRCVCELGASSLTWKGVLVFEDPQV
ncbi:MAG TPA: hypothetical protein VHF47_00860 [Acidimicrobiales bacterium]|nr:hypothetical protein [Acidimicrobiales bacterium]